MGLVALSLMVACNDGSEADDPIDTGSPTDDTGEPADGTDTADTGGEDTDTPTDPTDPPAGCDTVNDRVFVVLANNDVDDQGNFVEPPSTMQEVADVFDLTTDWFVEHSWAQHCMDYDIVDWIDVELTDGDDDPTNPAVWCAVLDLGYTPEELETYDRTFIGYATGGTVGNATGLGSQTGPVLEAGQCYEGSPALDLSTHGAAKVAYMGPGDDGLTVHELGHTLGLSHATFTSGWSGQIGQYSDLTDTMGSTSKRGGFTGVRRLELGWMPEDAFQSVSTDGTYTMKALEQPDGVRSLRFQTVPVDEDDRVDEYWIYLEWRTQKELQDIANTFHGVQTRLVGIEEGEIIMEGQILDQSPETATAQSEDAALGWGRPATFETPDGWVTITPWLAAGDTVEVDFSFTATPPGEITDVSVIADVSESGDSWLVGVDAEATTPTGELSAFWNLGVGDEEVYTSPGITHDIGQNTELVIPKSECPAGCRLWALLSDGAGAQLWTPVDINGHVNTLPEIDADSLGCTETEREGTVKLAADAVDVDGDLLQFAWDIDGVTFPWRTPHIDVPGDISDIDLYVSDDFGASWVQHTFTLVPEDCLDR